MQAFSACGKKAVVVASFNGTRVVCLIDTGGDNRSSVSAKLARKLNLERTEAPPIQLVGINGGKNAIDSHQVVVDSFVVEGIEPPFRNAKGAAV